MIYGWAKSFKYNFIGLFPWPYPNSNQNLKGREVHCWSLQNQTPSLDSKLFWAVVHFGPWWSLIMLDHWSVVLTQQGSVDTCLERLYRIVYTKIWGLCPRPQSRNFPGHIRDKSAFGVCVDVLVGNFTSLYRILQSVFERRVSLVKR